MQPSERADFREIVIASCRHVLPQCGLPIDPNPTDVTEVENLFEELAAFIGFTGEALRGAVTMLAPVQLLRQSYPVSLKTGLEGKLQLFDWCGEIVNRLLGRIRGGLATRGVEIEPSTPKALMGEEIQLVVLERSAVCSLQFSCALANMTVIVDAIAPEGVTLFHEPVDVGGVAKEGELLLL
jgi:hypothetical protein